MRPRRQPARWREGAVVEQRFEAHQVVQGHLAGEQPAAQAQPVLLQRAAEEGVHGDQPAQVHGVLGEGVAAGERHAAEHALGRDEALRLVLPAIEEVAEHLQEVGALQGHGHRLDAQADPLHALDVDAAGDLLGERGQALLGGGDPRRGQAQAAQVRLFAAVDRGERMHQRLVVEQLAAVVVAEGGPGAKADPRWSGGGLGDQLRVQLHRDHARAEELVQVALQLQRQRGRRDRHLLLRRQQLMVQLAGDLDEVPCGLARGGPVAGQRLVRAAEQRDRLGAGLRRAQHLEQRGGAAPAGRGFAQVVAERMAGLGRDGDRVQLAPLRIEVQRWIGDLRQRRLAAAPALEEPDLDPGRPTGQRQQADVAHRLDHARVERGVVGQVARRAGHDGGPAHPANRARRPTRGDTTTRMGRGIGIRWRRRSQPV